MVLWLIIAAVIGTALVAVAGLFPRAHHSSYTRDESAEPAEEPTDPRNRWPSVNGVVPSDQAPGTLRHGGSGPEHPS